MAAQLYHIVLPYFLVRNSLTPLRSPAICTPPLTRCGLCSAPQEEDVEPAAPQKKKGAKKSRDKESAVKKRWAQGPECQR